MFVKEPRSTAFAYRVRVAKKELSLSIVSEISAQTPVYSLAPTVVSQNSSRGKLTKSVAKKVTPKLLAGVVEECAVASAPPADEASEGHCSTPALTLGSFNSSAAAVVQPPATQRAVPRRAFRSRRSIYGTFTVRFGKVSRVPQRTRARVLWLSLEHSRSSEARHQSTTHSQTPTEVIAGSRRRTCP